MDATTLAITVYCLIDGWLAGRRLRQRGPQPTLADSEVLTIECVGEFWASTRQGPVRALPPLLGRLVPGPGRHPPHHLDPPGGQPVGGQSPATAGPSRLRPSRLDPGQLPDAGLPPDCSFWLGLEHVQHLATALAVIRPRLSHVYMAGGFSELLRVLGSCAASSSFISCYATPTRLSLIDKHTSRQRR
jgi:hypothetical protein